MWSFLNFFKGSIFNLKGINNSTITIIQNNNNGDGNPIVKEKREKHELPEEDRKNYIGEIGYKEIISRTYSSSGPSEETSRNVFFGQQQGLSLLEICRRQEKAIILGNPGLGKTTELEQLALSIWDDKSNPVIPVVFKLKNFTASHSLDDFIHVPVLGQDNILLIMDGLDEIVDIQDFVSKLEIFISQLESTCKGVRFLISCRTNIYEDIVQSIHNFQVNFLNDLTLHEGKNILKLKIGKSVDDESFDDFIIPFLANPFQIHILADYINKNGNYPNNTAELWRSYIEKRLLDDTRQKFIKNKIIPAQINSASKDLSVIMELMRTNVIKEDEIFEIIQDSELFEDFKRNPLVDKNPGAPTWYFIHKNIQEYFAALSFSEKSLEEILSFIEVENTGKTHPNLFNTITFLINLLPEGEDKYNMFISWISENEEELLFRADNNRISEELRIKVFQNHFNKVCKEQTLWINTDRTFETSRIARFAQCDKNFQFLLDIIKSEDLHKRTRISAISILSDFKIPKKEVPDLKEIFQEMLKNSGEYDGVKSKIIQLVESHRDFWSDDLFINDLFKIFLGESNKEINASLLHLLKKVKDINRGYITAFILGEFRYAHGLKKRKLEDKVGRGNTSMVETLILRINTAEIFLEIFKNYFIEQNLYSSEHFWEDVLQKCKFFVNNDKNFLGDLLDISGTELGLHKEEKFLLDLICATDSTDFALFHLLKKDYEKTGFFCINLVTNSNLESVVEILSKKELGNKEMQKFRNWLGNLNNRDLATVFDKKMSKKGFVFSEPVVTTKQEKRDKERFLKNQKKNILLLFRKKNLKETVKKEFFKPGVQMTWEMFHERELAWYRTNGHSSINLAPSFLLIQKLLHYNEDPLKWSTVRDAIDEGFIQILIVREILEEYQKRQIDIELTKKQKRKIKMWCFQRANDLKLDNVIRFYEDGSFSYIGTFCKQIETIFHFQKIFNIALPKKFLLRCIEFYDFDRSWDPEDRSLLKIRSLIDDEIAFKKQVLSNLRSKTLFSFSKFKHISYILQENIEEGFPLVEEYLQNKDLYNGRTVLESYYNLTRKNDFLQSCCVDNNDILYWTAVKLMVANDFEKERCVEKAIFYLEEISDKEYPSYITDALEVLFLTNDVRAISFLHVFIKEGVKVSLNYVQTSTYTAIDDITRIEDLYFLIYNSSEDIEFGYYRRFFEDYLNNLVKCEKYNASILSILEKIKNKLSNDGAELFYIYLLINRTKTNIINNKSKAYTFPEAHQYLRTRIKSLA